MPSTHVLPRKLAKTLYHSCGIAVPRHLASVAKKLEKLGKLHITTLLLLSRGLWGGSALLKCSPVHLVNSGHPYLNAFLPPFHPIITGARNYCYEDKRAHNLANSRSSAA